MKILKAIAVIAATIALTSCTSDRPRIHIIGGTTVCESDANATQACGWGQMLGQIVPPGVEVFNCAKAWSTCQSYYTDGSWAETKKAIRPGDVVLIQFAHDDEKAVNPDGKGTNSPWGTFQEGLAHFIDETRQAGARPILVQPIVRRIFDGNSIAPRGAHNFGRTPDNNSLDYTAAIRSLADSLGVPVIDLCTKSKKIVESYGIIGSKEQLFVNSDNTNTNAKGAALMAIAVAEALDSMNIWVGNRNTPSIVASQRNIDLGKVFVGDTLWKVIDIVNIDGITTRRVLNHKQLITVTAPSGYKLSRSPGAESKDSLLFFTDGAAQVVICYAPKGTTPDVGSLDVRTPNGVARIKLAGQGKMPDRRDKETFEWKDVTTTLDNRTINLKLSAIRGLELTHNGVMPIGGIWSPDPTIGEYVQLKLTNKDKAIRINEISLSTTSSQTYKVSCALGYDFFRNLTVGQRDVNDETADNSQRTDSFKTSIHLTPGQTMLIRLYIASPSTSLAMPFHIGGMKISMDTFE